MMTRTSSWEAVRRRRPPHESAVAEHRARFAAEQTAYRLREIREQQGLTQAEVAERMGLTQPTVSALESGDLSRSGLATLHAYITALGGTVELTAASGTACAWRWRTPSRPSPAATWCAPWT